MRSPSAITALGGMNTTEAVEGLEQIPSGTWTVWPGL